MYTSLLDRYILTSFLKKLTNILLVFVSIFLVVDIIEDIDKIIDYSIDLRNASMIYYYSIPQYINIAFPMAILIATVMTFTILQKNNELTALKAAGVSIYRLSIPFIAMGIFFAVSMFYFDNIVVTKSTELKFDQENKFYKKRGETKSTSNILIQLGDNRVLSIEKFNHRTNVGTNISLQRFNNNSMYQRIDAESMKWNDKKWFFNNIVFRDFNREKSYHEISDSSIVLNVNPLDLIANNTKPEEMNYWDLKLFISKLKNNGKEYNKWLVDLHFKTAFAFSNVLMILFGISLSIQKPRSNLLSGVGLSILVIFLYYIMIKSGQTLGYKGALSPFLSVWISNIFFFSLGGLLLYRAKT